MPSLFVMPHRAVGFAVALLASSDLAAAQVREVFQRVNPSVVVIRTMQRITEPATSPYGVLADEGVGSGVLVSADGLVLTAAHVVTTADRVEVEFLGGETVAASVLAGAPFADVALLRLERVPSHAVVAPIGDSSRAEVGDQVFAIGAPYGISHTLTVGWVSGRRVSSEVIENLTALEAFQLDMAIYAGNSGGPLFSLAGEVIGLVTHVLAPDRHAGGPAFAVTSNVARQLMLEERRVWLGFETVLVEGSLAASLNLPQPAGLLVQSVAEGSLGERLGLREGVHAATIGDRQMLLGGDVVLAILDIPIEPGDDALGAIQRRVTQLRLGDQLEIRVFRAGRIVTLRTAIPSQ